MAESTLVIITADHGGMGKGHGGSTPEEAEIAMIFYGKDIRKGYKIQQQVYTYDLAATIAFAFHLTPPYAWTGRPVKAAFEGFEEPANLWKGKEVIASPVIFPKRNLYQQAGGLYINEPATVKINGNIVVNNDGDHGVTEEAGNITLDTGRHPIKVEFFNAAGGYWLDVFYKGPGVAKQLVPANKLFLR